MPFEMFIQDRAYQARLTADKNAGRCAGQSVTWVLDMLENKVDSLSPADLDRGARYQDKYEVMFDTHSRGGLGANEHLFKSIAYSAKNPHVRTDVSRSIKDDVCVAKGMGRMQVDKFMASSGNAFLVMHWDNGTDGHSMALAKTKNNGRIYLYEPNSGVVAYSAGELSLYDDIKQVLIQRRIITRSPELRMSVLLSTPLDLRINL